MQLRRIEDSGTRGERLCVMKLGNDGSGHSDCNQSSEKPSWRRQEKSCCTGTPSGIEEIARFLPSDSGDANESMATFSYLHANEFCRPATLVDYRQ